VPCLSSKQIIRPKAQPSEAGSRLVHCAHDALRVPAKAYGETVMDTCALCARRLEGPWTNGDDGPSTVVAIAYSTNPPDAAMSVPEGGPRYRRIHDNNRGTEMKGRPLDPDQQAQEAEAAVASGASRGSRTRAADEEVMPPKPRIALDKRLAPLSRRLRSVAP
jgi:hypothetical protein